MGGFRRVPNAYINFSAIIYSLRALISPHIISPHIQAKSLAHIDFDVLSNNGIKYLLLDKDNTITLPRSPETPPQILSVLEKIKGKYPGNAYILSNSHLSVKMFDNLLGIPFLAHSYKKPNKKLLYDIMGAFPTANPEEVCIIGDRLFTDVMLGNLLGILTIYTYPLDTSLEVFSAMFCSYVEALLLKILPNNKYIGLEKWALPSLTKQLVLEQPKEPDI